MLPFTVHPVGDCALLAGFPQRIAPEIGAAVAELNSRVLAAKLPGVTETVPAFASLLVVYDPLVTDYDTLAAALQGLSDADGADTAAGEGRLVTIRRLFGIAETIFFEKVLDKILTIWFTKGVPRRCAPV